MLKGRFIMVIIKCMDMPTACYMCYFSKRFDNLHTYCEFHSGEELIEDGTPIPEYCELIDCNNEK